jgi:dTDP-4-dehydrorhamnose 3,5-epimerase
MSALPAKQPDAFKKISTSLPGLLILEPRVFEDERGFFLESYNERALAELGIEERFVQDNHSSSHKNVLRGLHYQVRQVQGKLVRVVVGEILDVAVDLRCSSPTFGGWQAVRLSGENKRMLWVPAGFAHGFRVVTDQAHVLYKTTLAWNDPDLKIDWELDGDPVISARDQRGVHLRSAETFE